MPIYIPANWNKDGCTRPSDFIDPKSKQDDPKWSLGWCNYILGSYTHGSCGIKSDDIAKFEKLRSYALGRQSTTPYKNIWLGGEQTSPSFPISGVDTTTGTMSQTRMGWMDVNFDEVFNPLPSILAKIQGIMSSNEHDIFVTAQDEKSMTLRETEKAMSIVRNMLQSWRTATEGKLGIPPQNEAKPLPKSVEELPIFESMGSFKLPYEIGMEKALDHTEYISDYKKIKRSQIFDMVSINMTATESFKDPVSGVVKDKWVDVEDLIIEDSYLEDFKSSTFYGVQESISAVDLQAQTGWGEKEMEELGRAYQGVYGNPAGLTSKINMFSGSTSYDWSGWRFPLLRCVWKTTDSEYYTKRKNEEGKDIEAVEPYRTNAEGQRIAPKVYKTEKRETYKTDIRTLYKARWIIGTDKVYDFGKFYDIPYDFVMKEPELPIHVFRGTGKSMTESSILVLDEMAMAVYRFQNAIAKAPPPGLRIEFGSLEEMTFDNKKWTPLDILKLYSHTGNLLYRFSPAEGGIQSNSGKPIEELRGGLGTAADDFIKTLNALWTMLASVTGIDQFSAASKSPTSDQAVGVTELAVASTNDTLRPIYNAYITLKENQSRCDALMIQSVLESDRGTEAYSKIIGRSAVEAIKAAGNDPPVEFGFKIVAKPSQQSKTMIIEAASGALKTGVLTFSDFAFITECVNNAGGLKYARAYLEYKEGVRAAQAAKAQEENPKIQAEAQAMLVKMKTEGDIATIKAKGEQDRETELLKAALTTKLNEHQNLLNMELAKLQQSIQPTPQATPQATA